MESVFIIKLKQKFLLFSLKNNSLNTVGWGDVFGAVFFYNYIKTKNINLALHKAVQAASLTAAGLTSNEIKDYS